ncbi:MAG TPA: hypothetical protein VN636_16250 [Acidimicrobiia bacterium]|nr:hypothetical protein [Acidimicrobiia bacterium]
MNPLIVTFSAAVILSIFCWLSIRFPGGPKEPAAPKADAHH